jgi:GMP synthase-like glutamine amidotransferase
MNILLVDNGSKHLDELVTALLPHITTTASYSDLAHEDTEHVDCIILTGGKKSVLGHSWLYRKEIKLIKNSNKPVIGICLGFELIALAYGSRLHRRHKKVHGLRGITLRSDLFGKSEAKVYEAHRWYVKHVPNELEVLATSSKGVEIIRHKMKPIYGLQFHPEVHTASNDGASILATILGLLS